MAAGDVFGVEREDTTVGQDGERGVVVVVALLGCAGADDGVIGLAVGEVVAGDAVLAAGLDVAGVEGAVVDDGAFVVEPGPRAVGGDLDGVAGQGGDGRGGAEVEALDPGAGGAVEDVGVSIV